MQEWQVTTHGRHPRAEHDAQKLAEINARRPPAVRPPPASARSASEWEPPEPGEHPSTSSNRAARFRDQHLYGPPPPLPPRAYARTAHPADSSGRPIRGHGPTQLVEPDLFEQGLSPPVRPSIPPEIAPPMAQSNAPSMPQHTPQQNAQQTAQPAVAPALSIAQKKRARRRRNRANQPAPPAATIAPPAVEERVHPTNGLAYPPTSPTQPTPCPGETLVAFPSGVVVRVRCEATIFPHPNAPHLRRLAPAEPATAPAEIFIGWYLPGE